MREWHTVTVASRSSSRCATGFPTTVERPSTTACRPASATSWWSRSASTAAAVAGAKAGRPAARRPRLSGFAPSTSLAGSIAVATSVEVDPGWQGCLQDDPVHRPVGGEPAQGVADVLGTRLGARSTTSQVMPTAAAALAMDRTYQAADSSLVARTTASRGVVPAAASAGGRAATRAADRPRPAPSRSAAGRGRPQVGCRRSSRQLRADRGGQLVGALREDVHRPGHGRAARRGRRRP